MRKIIRRENGTLKITTVNNEPSKTDQSHKNSVDINNILHKYRAIHPNHLLNLPENTKGVYGDFSKVKSYQQSLDMVINAQNAFDALPAPLRKQFSNNPAELLSFLDDPKNKDEAIRLGIINKPAEAIEAAPPSPTPPSPSKT